MALRDNFKIVHFVIFVILLFFVARANSECKCSNIPKNFNETVKDVVHSTCRKCYMYVYDFTLEEDWAPLLCISSPLVSPHTPLLVVVREYISITSFQVPQIFEDKRKSSFKDVCRTLCPLANYFDDRLNVSQQIIFVEVSTRSEEDVEFEFKLSMMQEFIIMDDQPLTVSITPSQPRVIQYNMKGDLEAVRIEATSQDEKCMILSIEDIQCPFSDSDSALGRSGYYQTLMKKSGLLINKQMFSMGRVYAVLILKTSNDLCTATTESYENEMASGEFLSKEVTIRVVPVTSDGQFYLAVFVVLIPYLSVYLIALIDYCCCGQKEISDVDIEDGRNLGSNQNPSPVATGSNNEQRSLPDETKRAEMEPLIPKTKIYLSELTRKKEDVMSRRTKLYAWNLCAIAVFFAVPAIQLVFINQGIVNLTGNQDLCYYNFLCSYHYWPISDFNHFYSNIGYVLLGFIFLLFVRRRENAYKEAASERLRLGNNEAVGVSYHFGLFYAMGAASIMEGVLSATYHVCPNKANFQFDTAFMYVIVAMCMLRVYQARHPDITPKSHSVWIFLSIVIFINGADALIPWPIVRSICHVIVCLGHLVPVFIIGNKIYYAGRNICGEEIPKRHDAVAEGCCGFYFPDFKVQFITFCLVMGLHIAWTIYHFVEFFYFNRGDLASFFLIEFIGNLVAYIIYYLVMKFSNPPEETKATHPGESNNVPQEGSAATLPAGSEVTPLKEKKCMVFIYLGLMCVSWAVAIVFFCLSDSDWKATPAKSREANTHCLMLQFYDRHDLWHFASSFGIFFSYMVLLCIDDDLQNTPKNKILVF